MTRSQETKLVKDALKASGINSEVSHGHGTAWGWLHINVGSSEQFGPHTVGEHESHYDCAPCKRTRELAKMALEIAQQVTGRHGQYDGCINVHTQRGWTDKKGSYEILQIR